MVNIKDLMIRSFRFKHHLMILSLFSLLLVAAVAEINMFDSDETIESRRLINTTTLLDAEAEREMLAIMSYYQPGDGRVLTGIMEQLQRAVQELAGFVKSELVESGEHLLSGDEE
ncbi:MAG: hypothetical protein Q9M13_02805, partial [Mariprofundales bacterium]|nr:hypothetical protein [Mariprofundales bacterium]